MIPSRRLPASVLALCIVALLAAFVPSLQPAWKVLSAVVVGAALLDLLLSRKRPALTLNREIRHSIPVAVWSPVTLILENRGSRALQLTVHDHHPAWFDADQLPRPLDLPGNRVARIGYRVRPTHRGDGHFKGADLVCRSPLGFWQRKIFVECPERVQVFPNFRQISRYALLATDHRLSQMGVRRRQRRGEGSDFHQLREYRAGDSLRQIEWKASSRYRRLISKESQDERDQQVVFMLDCGRRMRHAEQGQLHLDQALNAILLLTHVAAQQGDAVGFLSFGGSNRWLPPSKGGDPVKRLLHGTYDLESSTEAADYLVAARELMSVQHRRALVVIVTNTRGEDQDDLTAAVRLLQRRHLVVVANLRESLLDQTMSQPVRDFDGALRFHATGEYLDSRRRSLETLRHQGTVVLDLLASHLPVVLVNNYLTIKASGAL